MFLSRCLRRWRMRWGVWRGLGRCLRSLRRWKWDCWRWSRVCPRFQQPWNFFITMLVLFIGLYHLRLSSLFQVELGNSGFGFAISSYQASDDLANVPAFHYAEYDVEDSILPLQPSLNYTAPEMVQSRGSPAGSASDIFSFRCLAYQLIAHKPLFDCHNNMEMYTSSLTYLTNGAFTSIPSELVPDLQIMLSTNESFRPTALEFTGSPFFRDDTRLCAFRFLDHMLESDKMQKFEFLKALSDMMEIHAEQLVMIIISMLTRIGHSQFCSRPSLRQYSQKEILKLMSVMPSKLKRLHEP